MRSVDLTATPRAVVEDLPMPFSDIDAALCSNEGIHLFKGSDYYLYETPMILAMNRMAPVPQPVTNALLGCQD